MIDFDGIEAWAPKLSCALGELVPEGVKRALVASAPEYVEDACALLLDATNRDAVIDTTMRWIESSRVVGYHGSRLTQDEVDSIRSAGLIPLKAESRAPRLARALSSHVNWVRVADRLNAEIRAHGEGDRAGHREGQVHLTLSKFGLINGFDHYLTYGSEFDQHVAHSLLGADGKSLLARDGESRVIKVAVPGEIALQAAHRYFSIEYMRSNGEVPNLVRDFLNAWSFRIAYSDFESRTLEIDSGLVFESTVPACWIVDIETLGD